jgi:hypothetical protein
MKKTLLILLGAILCVPGLTRADTTYTYTGQPFNQFFGTDSCSGGVGQCSLQGSFTVAGPLASDLTDVAINPTSFSLTDGNTTITDANLYPGSFAFDVTTDATGTIVGWLFQAADAPYPPVYAATYTGLWSCFNVSQCTPGYTPADDSNVGIEFVGGTPGQAMVIGTAGTWSDPPTPAPEPSSLLLTTLGLLAVGILGLRKREKLAAAAISSVQSL